MAEDLSLSSAVRSNQLSLRNAAEMMARTDGRSGAAPAPAVNAAPDSSQPSSLAPASELAAFKQDLARGIGAASKALGAIDTINALISQLQKLVNGVMAATSADMAAFTKSFNDLRKQIDQTAAAGDYLGINLVSGTSQSLTVSASSDGSVSITLTSVSFTAVGLNIGEAPTSAASLRAMSGTLTAAMGALNNQAQALGSGLTQLQNALASGGGAGQGRVAGVASVKTAEVASLLALQTRQQLSSQSMSFAGQAEQGVLGLFRS